jgi:diguanylate cyclase (GGDEF)-like protein
MEDRARRDALTQTANRHAFDAELEKLLRRCSQEAAPCSLLLLDVDHFKSINDQHGHLVGDAALKAIAQAVQQTVHHGRATDRPLVARYGGEEFAVLLPDLPLSAALRIAEEIRLAIERLRIPLARGELRVTASLGASASPEHGDQPQPLLHAADQALYAAKRAGRNRVLAAGHALVIRSEPAASARELSATVS